MKNCGNEAHHVHEFLGSTRLAELNSDDVHNHRFAGVTGEPIQRNKSHVHRIITKTDFFDHYHEIEVCTGPAISVGDGRHVHFVYAMTECKDGHKHSFIVATLIEAPIFEEKSIY